MEKNKYDASAIDFSRCDMDGATLCNCAPEELRLVFGPLGDQLYSQLWDLSKCGCGARGVGRGRQPGSDPPSSPPAASFPDELSWIIELLEKDSMAFQESLGPFGESPRPPPSVPQLQGPRAPGPV